MKKTLIASLAVLASAAVVATFALGGAGKFGDVQVHADPVEYSVIFDENASSQEVTIGSRTYYVFHTTTDNGNRVGVVGGSALMVEDNFFAACREVQEGVGSSSTQIKGRLSRRCCGSACKTFCPRPLVLRAVLPII